MVYLLPLHPADINQPIKKLTQERVMIISVAYVAKWVSRRWPALMHYLIQGGIILVIQLFFFFWLSAAAVFGTMKNG